MRYIYDGNLEIQWRDGNNLPTLTLTRGRDLSGSLQDAGGIGGLLSRTDAASGQTAYFHADGNGNVTALINGQRIVVAKYLYDPFGNTLSKAGPIADANTYRFSSQEYHQPSGLSLYLYRAYDPNLQRWLNRDPIEEEGGLNLYGFVSNNPLQFVDLSGLDWIEYTGEKLTLYDGNIGDRTKSKKTCKATSGLNGFQNPQNTGLKDRGPVPAGDYSINLVPDPNRTAKADRNTGELTSNKDGGIEIVPPSFTTRNGTVVTYPGWGTWRARLNPKPKTDTKKRNYFYFHNSKKGYSHGCIETCDELLNALKDYRNDGNKAIDVRIDYRDRTTYGETDK